MSMLSLLENVGLVGVLVVTLYAMWQRIKGTLSSKGDGCGCSRSKSCSRRPQSEDGLSRILSKWGDDIKNIGL